MTPRELLKAWLDLSENRCLSVETYLERGDGLFGTPTTTQQTDSERALLARWALLDFAGYGRGKPHEADPESYWAARKQLEADTRKFLEMDDE